MVYVLCTNQYHTLRHLYLWGRQPKPPSAEAVYCSAQCTIHTMQYLDLKYVPFHCKKLKMARNQTHELQGLGLKIAWFLGFQGTGVSCVTTYDTYVNST